MWQQPDLRKILATSWYRSKLEIRNGNKPSILTISVQNRETSSQISRLMS